MESNTFKVGDIVYDTVAECYGVVTKILPKDETDEGDTDILVLQYSSDKDSVLQERWAFDCAPNGEEENDVVKSFHDFLSFFQDEE